MEIKKLHIALLFLTLSVTAGAQTAKVMDAVKMFQAKDLEGARKSIELASADPESAKDPATWYYKAFILKEYYRSKETTVKNASSRTLAIEAAKKNIAIDPKNKYADECKKIINFLLASFYNEASASLNEQKFAQAYDSYVKYLEVKSFLDPTKIDTTAIFYAGYTAYRADNKGKAKEYLRKAADLKYPDPTLYVCLGKIYWSLGEKENAYKALDEGHKRFPENKDILLSMVNHYMEEGKLKDLEKTLDKAITIDAKNIDLKLTQALVAEKLAEANKSEYEKYFSKSESLYIDVLKQDINNVRANYNLAILYYNKAVSIIDNMDPDSDLTTLDKIQEKCLVIFKQSLPYMEKAYTLDPTRKDVLEGLAGIYFAINDIPKSNEFKAKSEALHKK